ncbi:DNA-binding transcriptional LysR family regulator [Sinobacterium caligoides]|uniref:DNA-binding transcriptional LysR family regulator n=1 Tax=Sinobacterium caligoides TaxID=933926 RepID=A0A3N2E0R6_9GAMM|nr:LysR family transcriptional regulator [Sinobacterium caligoides]ROS05229.1 DNA-binding transcriptional LysR family regulator [Sinobacterium caligoides]
MSTNKAIHLLHEMAVFVRVVKTGSFSEAARQLGSSPSSISRSIKKLEEALDVCLLLRTTRKLRLSDSGEAVYQRCLEMESAAVAAVDCTKQYTEQAKGLLRISAPKATGLYIIHPHIAEFLRLYPQVDVQLTLDDIELDMIDNDIDIQLRMTQTPPPGLMGRKLLNIDFVVCASPRYLAERGTPQKPQDLESHSCLSIGQEPGDSKWRFKRGQASHVVQVQGRYIANHTGARLDAAQQDIGIAILPRFVAEAAISSGKIIQLLPDWNPQTAYSGDLWLLYAASRHQPPHLQAFVRFIAEKIAAK